MITVEEAVNSLYERASESKYKATAYWTTAREFTPSYEAIPFKQEFQQSKPKEGFKPFEIPQFVKTSGTP